MKWIGVITGDIVGSSEILKAGDRGRLLEVMKNTAEELNAAKGFGNIKIEIYRGDSFQITTDHIIATLDLAVLFRANIIANSYNGLRWDVRMGIGLGKDEYNANKVSESDGEAFHLAGKAFDNLDKNSFMCVKTPNEDFNIELLMSTAFADDIISNWTINQASVFWLSLVEELNQKEIAQKEKKTPQTISKIYNAGKIPLIMNYLVRSSARIFTLNKSHDEY